MVDLGRTESVCKKNRLRQSIFLPFRRMPGGSRRCMTIKTMTIEGGNQMQKEFKKTRNMKVYEMSGYRYKPTPTIMLKGQWLRDLGFDIGGYVSVSCENGRLVITPDTERAELMEAEAAFMERETKLLQKRFEAEKKQLHAQFVAERQAQYGVDERKGV